MKIKEEFVILFKAPKIDEELDKYETTLTENGFEVAQVKTLDFEYKNLLELKEKLDEPSRFSGIIFSSPRCVYGVKHSLNDETLHCTWNEKCNYVVGNGTYEAALKYLDLECNGKESGNAYNLGDIIIKDKTNYDLRQPFLFPHGNLKMDLLKNKLSPENITLDEVCVYDSIVNKEIDKEFQEITMNFMKLPQYIVFFSPSAFNGAFSVLQRIPVKMINNIKIIPIGVTTEKVIKDNGYNIFGVPKQPTPVDLLDVIK